MEIQDKARFKKRFSNQRPSKFPKACDDRVSKPMSQKERRTSSPNKKPTCGNYGKKHMSECLGGRDNSFGCGKSGHKGRDCPNVWGQEKGSGQAQESVTTCSKEESLLFSPL